MPEVELTPAQRQAVAELVPTLADAMRLDESGARSVEVGEKETKLLRLRLERAMTDESDRRRLGVLARLYEATGPLGVARGPWGGGKIVYQFRITLLDCEPAIWRQIRVEDCTLEKLHEHIQTAMGWENCHLHQFEIDGQRLSDPKLFGDGFGDFEDIDSTTTKVSDIAPDVGGKFAFLYVYDMGDSWEHEVLLEEVGPAEKGERLPRCVAGDRACPPEDSGGFFGFGEFLDALEDPNHERHVEFIEWVGDYDPAEFDPKAATRAMKKGLPFGY